MKMRRLMIAVALAAILAALVLPSLRYEYLSDGDDSMRLAWVNIGPVRFVGSLDRFTRSTQVHFSAFLDR